MSMRFSKVRITRPGEVSISGLDRLERLQAEEKRNADKWVMGLSRTALEGMWNQMAGDYAHDRKDPLQRWKMAKKAAVGRAISNLSKQ